VEASPSIIRHHVQHAFQFNWELIQPKILLDIRASRSDDFIVDSPIDSTFGCLKNPEPQRNLEQKTHLCLFLLQQQHFCLFSKLQQNSDAHTITIIILLSSKQKDPAVAPFRVHLYYRTQSSSGSIHHTLSLIISSHSGSCYSTIE
jgi:hypothetical protein